MHKELWHDGVRLVSVTQLQALINKPFLEKWKEGLCSNQVCGFVEAKNIAEQAAEFSNVIHAEVSQYLTDGTLPEVPNEWSAKIIAHMRENGVKKYLIEPEQTLRVNKANLSGSPDMVCEGWGKKFIGDNKIKKSLDATTGAQLYGYRLLIKKLYGEDINTGAVFFGNKKTNTLRVIWIDLDEWKAYFKSLVVVWNVHNPSRKVNLSALR